MRFILLALILSISACADAQNEDFRKTLEKRLNKSFEDLEVTAVKDAPVEGMLEVEVNGRDRIHVTEDGQYMFTGTLFALSDDGAEDVSRRRFREARRKGLSKIDLDRAISFEAEDEQAEVYAFTDVTCGYCQKLHRQIGGINDRGITVHYLAYPRGGMNGQGAALMQKVWCAEDRQSALTSAKARGALEQEPQACDDPVEAQYQKGVEFGVRGTPSIYTPEGKKLGGYLPPEKLAAALELDAAESGN
jgi:thiol:disulfide interchange protein DsbC